MPRDTPELFSELTANIFEGDVMSIRVRALRPFVGGLFLSGCAGVASAANVAAPAAPIEVTFASGERLLHGFVYKPGSKGPFRAVLWNHGSERRPGWLPKLGPLFVARGYVFFIPHRRGQGRSPGDYIMDLLNPENASQNVEPRSKKLAELMDEHLQDQIAALNYLKSLPYVDNRRIAVAGCSFGGIQTILAAGQQLGLRAAVDFAGAAQTWTGASEMRERMLAAVHRATVPVLLIQAANDYDLAPTRALDEELKRAGKPHKVEIFPPFGRTHQDGHELCVRGGEIWAPTVFSFLENAMK
jgi:carboxymethylenebutenolidase